MIEELGSLRKALSAMHRAVIAHLKYNSWGSVSSDELPSSGLYGASAKIEKKSDTQFGFNLDHQCW
jgi:hypothetical protein